MAVKVEVYYSDDVRYFPIKTLEQAIIECLYMGLKKSVDGGIEMLHVRISKERVIIKARCNRDMDKVLMQVIDECYILNHLDFDTIVTYERIKK